MVEGPAVSNWRRHLGGHSSLMAIWRLRKRTAVAWGADVYYLMMLFNSRRSSLATLMVLALAWNPFWA